MIVSWNFYVRRKRINIKEWLTRKNIKDYNELVKVTKKLGIEPPTEKSVVAYFDTPEKNKNDKKIKKPATKRATKPATKRATKPATKRATKSTASGNAKIIAEDKDDSGCNLRTGETTEQDSKPPTKRKRRARKKRQPAKEENQ